jgi:hypothetical protein
MGQRHQFYFQLHVENKITVSRKKIKTHMISFHDQWAYGTLPLRMLSFVLMFNRNAEKDYDFSHPKSFLNRGMGYDLIGTIKSLLEVNAQTGHLSHLLNTTDETCLPSGRHDPLRGDNNDGITVVDFTVKGKPAYAFVNIHESNPKFLDPMTAEEYVTSYYPKTDPKWEAWNIPLLIKRIDRMARPLTVKELAVLFPTMYKDWFTERNRILKDPKRAPAFAVTAKFNSNRQYAEQILANAV